MKIQVGTTLYCGALADIDLPIIQWSDIKDWHIKWDTLHYTIDGENWLEFELGSEIDEVNAAWKRPIGVSITDPETGEELASKF